MKVRAFSKLKKGDIIHFNNLEWFNNLKNRGKYKINVILKLESDISTHPNHKNIKVFNAMPISYSNETDDEFITRHPTNTVYKRFTVDAGDIKYITKL